MGRILGQTLLRRDRQRMGFCIFLRQSICSYGHDGRRADSLFAISRDGHGHDRCHTDALSPG